MNHEPKKPATRSTPVAEGGRHSSSRGRSEGTRQDVNGQGRKTEDYVEREPRLHQAQRVSPGGNKPTTAMCEKEGEPGLVNKDEDC